MFVNIGFDRDFDQSLLKEAKNVLTNIKGKAKKKLDDANKKINELSDKVSDFAKKGVKTIDKKIADVKSDIASLGRDIEDLKDERSDAKKWQLRVKAKLTVKILAKRTVLAAKKVALELLLKPGKKALSGSEKLLDKATEEVTKAKILQRTLDRVTSIATRALDSITKGIQVIRVKSAAGSYSVKEMLAAKLPTIKVVVQTNFPGAPSRLLTFDMQLDLKKPAKLVSKLIKEVLKTLGIS